MKWRIGCENDRRNLWSIYVNPIEECSGLIISHTIYPVGIYGVQLATRLMEMTVVLLEEEKTGFKRRITIRQKKFEDCAKVISLQRLNSKSDYNVFIHVRVDTSFFCILKFANISPFSKANYSDVILICSGTDCVFVYCIFV